MADHLGRFTHEFIDVIAGTGRFVRFSGAAIAGIVMQFPRRSVLGPLMMEIGLKSVAVVLATGAFVGMVLAVQTYPQLHKMGAETSSGPIINLAIVAELGPVLAAIMLAGRVGGAMAAELGTMKVTEQIDALSTMGQDPITYLVTPRFLACLVLVPILTIYSDAIGVVGGYIMAVKFFGISDYYYWYQNVAVRREVGRRHRHMEVVLLRWRDRAYLLLQGVPGRPGGAGGRPGDD